MDEPEPAAI
jgi:hypothetical protein